jgi:hypothetical protein
MSAENPIFILHLRAKPDSRAPIQRLRSLLKDAGRRHGFACTDVREFGGAQAAARDGIPVVGPHDDVDCPEEPE